MLDCCLLLLSNRIGQSNALFGTINRFAPQQLCASQVLDEADLEPTLIEIGILRSIRWPTVVQYLGSDMKNNKVSLITEYMEGGSLWTAIRTKRLCGWSKE